MMKLLTGEAGYFELNGEKIGGFFKWAIIIYLVPMAGGEFVCSKWECKIRGGWLNIPELKAIKAVFCKTIKGIAVKTQEAVVVLPHTYEAGKRFKETWTLAKEG